MQISEPPASLGLCAPVLLKSPAFLPQLPNGQAWPKRWSFPLLPFVHLLDDVLYGYGCFDHGRYELRHRSSMLGCQEVFPAAHPLQKFRELSLGIVDTDRRYKAASNLTNLRDFSPNTTRNRAGDKPFWSRKLGLASLVYGVVQGPRKRKDASMGVDSPTTRDANGRRFRGHHIQLSTGGKYGVPGIVPGSSASISRRSDAGSRTRVPGNRAVKHGSCIRSSRSLSRLVR